MFVTGSTPLFTIGRMETMEVDVPVTQEMLSRLRPGQTAEIRSESLGDSVIRAEVSRISPFIEPGSFSAELQIDVDNTGGSLLPGMFVTVDVLYGESREATLVPKSAIYEDPATGAVGVYVAPSIGLEVPLDMPTEESGEMPAMTPPTPAEFQRVDILAEGRHVVGIEGIEPGSWVIVVGQHLVAGGRPGEGPTKARVRPIRWERLLELQGLQREDMLRQFMEKQQQIARASIDAAAERDSAGSD
jgi:multidrug efflux pump subunit AcrA (membrane-fusion protein)